MDKLFKWLIIFLLVIINYNSGATEEYKVRSAFEDNKYLHLIFQDGSRHKIRLDEIRNWRYIDA